MWNRKYVESREIGYKSEAVCARNLLHIANYSNLPAVTTDHSILHTESRDPETRSGWLSRKKYLYNHVSILWETLFIQIPRKSHSLSTLVHWEDASFVVWQGIRIAARNMPQYTIVRDAWFGNCERAWYILLGTVNTLLYLVVSNIMRNRFFL